MRFLSTAELQEAMRRLDTHLPAGDDLLLIVLKGHLLLEEQLEKIVRTAVPHPEFLPKRPSFSLLLALAKALRHEEAGSRPWPVVKRINEFRNAYAHSLEVTSVDNALREWMYEIGPEYVSAAWLVPGSPHELTASSLLRTLIWATYTDLGPAVTRQAGGREGPATDSAPR